MRANGRFRPVESPFNCSDFFTRIRFSYFANQFSRKWEVSNTAKLHDRVPSFAVLRCHTSLENRFSVITLRWRSKPVMQITLGVVSLPDNGIPLTTKGFTSLWLCKKRLVRLYMCAENGNSCK